MGIVVSTKKYNPIPIDKDDTIKASGISYNNGVRTVPMETQKFQHKKMSHSFKRYRDYNNGNVV